MLLARSVLPALAALTLTFSCIMASAQTAAPIKVGAILSDSGVSARLGVPQKQALEMLEDQVDAAGGVGGRKVHFDIEDDQAKADVTTQIATAMIARGIGAIVCCTRVDTTHIEQDDHGAYLQRVNHEHEDICAAIERCDPEAARAAMRTHLTNSRERLRKACESLAEESAHP